MRKVDSTVLMFSLFFLSIVLALIAIVGLDSYFTTNCVVDAVEAGASALEAKAACN